MTMYLPFFRLSQAPFTIAPDPRYLFMSERHREALAHLLYGVGGGGGIVLLTGEIGAGKTTVCRCFLEQIPAACRVAYIFNPRLTVTELLQTICAEFGIAPARVAGAEVMPTLNHYFNALNDYLLGSHAAGGKNVLIIDEAQNLSADVLEQLRLLTNLETSQTKLLQIILIGQPELRTMVARPELEQLAQRIIARFHLGSLSREETAQYIDHRLAVAGGAGAKPFSARVKGLIHRLCGGVPRRINLLCDRALLGAYTEGRPEANAAIVRRAAREVFGGAESAADVPRRAWWRGAAIGAAGGATVLALASVAMLSSGGGPLGGHGGRWWNGWKPPLPLQPAATAATAPAGSGPGTVAAAGLASSSGATPVKAAGQLPTAALAGAAVAPVTAAAGLTLMPGQPGGAGAVTSAGAGAAAPSIVQPPADAEITATTDANWLYQETVQPTAQLLPTLAAYWGVTLAAGDPCTAAPVSGLHCYVGRGGLAEVRQLNRPVVLGLRDNNRQIRPVLLLALNEKRAMLRLDGKPQLIALPELEKIFNGEFATFWRAPQAFRDYLRNGDQGPDVDWLAAQLVKARGGKESAGGQTFNDGLIQQLRAFQQTRGLVADGVAGPKTFMSLNQIAGVREPQLRNTADAVATEN